MHHESDIRETKVLIIAEAANSQWASVPLVGWSLANALHGTVKAHVVTQIRNRQSFLDNAYVEGVDFTAIDSEKLAKPISRLSNFLSGGEGKGWTTGMALSVISYYYFERLVWKAFGKRIKSGEFGIVHRVTPLSPTVPSVLARKCAKAGARFILGPLNGGVPWPKGFDKTRRQEREWLSYVRDAYKLLPGYKSSLRYSSAILAGSKFTLGQIPQKYSGKCFYIPENAINPLLFNKRTTSRGYSPLRACFVGRLVPYKGPDMLLEAALPFLKEKRMTIDIVGDGPLMPALKRSIEENGVSGQVTLHGWVEHSAVQEILCESSILAFPSIREFGGGVVLEAMALGVVPVVVDYAGPGELVDGETGIKVPMSERSEIVSGFGAVFGDIIAGKHDLPGLSARAMEKVMTLYTWAAKAAQVKDIYSWTEDPEGAKPEFFS